MQASVVFLGTGGSLGVPVIGCLCAVCTSPIPFNRRLRPSVLLKVGAKRFVLDVGPDFREQALRYQIDRLDGALFSHAHYDHMAGIDELRIYAFRSKRPVPCLVSSATLEELKKRYDYLLSTKQAQAVVREKLSFQLLEGEQGHTLFEETAIGYVSYFQLGMKVTGFQIGNFAYLTDLLDYSPALFDALQTIDILVVSGRRMERSLAHLSIDEALAFAARTSARAVYLTHLSHEIDYRAESRRLPKHVQLAYDGLEIAIECSS